MIAELSGFSKTTVSFVLNGVSEQNNISKATQEKILRIAEEQSYKVNRLAQSLSTGKTNCLGFIVPSISNPFFGNLARNIEKFAGELGYSVMIASTGEKFERELQMLEEFSSRSLDGIILATCAHREEEVEALKKIKTPIVYVDRVPAFCDSSYVGINNVEATELLVKELIEMGHKKIVLVSLTSFLPNIKDRIEGYSKAMKDNGLDNALIWEIDYNDRKQSIKNIIDSVLSREDVPYGFVFLNNEMASEAIWYLNKHHKDLVSKISFSCFDDLAMFDYVTPKVTSALQPIEEVAKRSVKMMANIIKSNKPQAGVLLDASIIKRK
ncbi:MAG: LacI family DNA-binding transcriptional regulator [Bacteroidales bacterium]